jgi:hypothetical protein
VQSDAPALRRKGGSLSWEPNMRRLKPPRRRRLTRRARDCGLLRDDPADSFPAHHRSRLAEASPETGTDWSRLSARPAPSRSSRSSGQTRRVEGYLAERALARLSSVHDGARSGRFRHRFGECGRLGHRRGRLSAGGSWRAPRRRNGRTTTIQHETCAAARSARFIRSAGNAGDLRISFRKCQSPARTGAPQSLKETPP